MTDKGNNRILFGNNLDALRSLAAGCVQLIYIDPPFNTGTVRRKNTLTTVANCLGDRVGFGGRRYNSSLVSSKSYEDRFDDFEGFMRPRLQEAHRILANDGSLFVHLDPRESHYCKIWLDTIFGRSSFLNEIIWAYDYGGRGRNRWPTKHDMILWYAKNPERYTFNYDSIDRIPYMAPGLVSPEKAERGKIPTDTWWNTIVGTNSREKTGYPTQKPLAILDRIVRVHSNAGDVVLDFFAGSGSMGEAAAKLGRNFILVDNNPEAIAVMTTRLSRFKPQVRQVSSEQNGDPRQSTPRSTNPPDKSSQGDIGDENKHLYISSRHHAGSTSTFPNYLVLNMMRQQFDRFLPGHNWASSTNPSLPNY